MGSSQTRARTHVSCISVWILHHWATKEALSPPDGSTSSWPSHSHTIQTDPTLYAPHPHCALCILTFGQQLPTFSTFILSSLPLPPLLALREAWLISLHLSWVETFSSYSPYAPYATSGWGWGEASSLFCLSTLIPILFSFKLLVCLKLGHPVISSINPLKFIHLHTDFPGGSDSKASAYKVGDPGSIPGLGRSSGERNGNPLQYSCLENPMDWGAW